MLPRPHLFIGRETMFDEQQLSTRLKDPVHLRERPGKVRNAAQGPGYQDGIHACAIQWNGFRRTFDQRRSIAARF
jgi:hypothetical protein